MSYGRLYLDIWSNVLTDTFSLDFGDLEGCSMQESVVKLIFRFLAKTMQAREEVHSGVGFVNGV